MADRPQAVNADEALPTEKELLAKAVTILKRMTRGYSISDKCSCVACAAGKFLNEIV